MPMNRRSFLGHTGRGLGAAVVGVNALSKASAEQNKQQHPNILWIMTDQQPVSTLGCYGNTLNPTPNLDRIAREGVRFDRFHIAAFPCSPSRACFLTGMYAHQHGVTTNDVTLNPDLPTLGTVCRDAGYATAFFGKSHLNGNMYRSHEGEDSPEAKEQDWQYRRVTDPERFKFEKIPGGIGEDGPQLGFDEFAGGWKHYHAYLREVGLGKLVDENPRLGNHNDLPSTGDHAHAYSQLPEEHHTAAFFRRRAVDFIERQQSAKNPFCMVVSFYGPHLPVAPPKLWDTKYSLDEITLPANHEDDLKNKPLGQFQNKRCYRGKEWTEEQYKDYIRRYYGYCAYIDYQIGMILDALESSGKADNTIVVFTSDHGDMVAAHGMVFKLTHCGYDELLRVPFLMRYPKRIDIGTTAMLASNVDALPTLLEYAGLSCPENVAGRSMAKSIGDNTFREYTFCNSMEVSYTITDKRWKFVANVNHECCNELYDRTTDPGELVNLINEDTYSQEQQRLQEALTGWLQDSKHPYAERIICDINTPLRPPSRMYPEVTQVEYIGNRRFRLGYNWHVETNPDLKEKYWSYCQFLNDRYGTDGNIAFRLVKWPDKPTQEWQAGDIIPIGPTEIEIPDTAGPGAYEVRIGLYEPNKKKNVTFAPPYMGIAGTLTVTADKSGAITGVSFAPAKQKGGV